jgi:glucuronate isomerase
MLHEDRLLPTDPATRAIARRLYAGVQGLPIVSPHGHTDPRWFAENHVFPDPAQLFVTTDHYVFRMLYSQGVPLEDVGVRGIDGAASEVDPRQVWRRLAEHYRAFAGTPTRLWLDYSFETLFGLTERLSPDNADHHYDVIAESLQRPEFRPRAMFERFNIEAIATTDGALDDLRWHERIAASGWPGRVIPTYRPDAVVDPGFPGFRDNLAALAELSGEDAASWSGYLAAHRKRRAFFKAHGATASDHGHPSAATADLSTAAAQALFARVIAPNPCEEDRELFRAQMLTEMAAMSLDDGLVMQIHAGSFRNHNPLVARRFGRDMGADIPTQIEYVRALKPLLDRFGNEKALTIIVFTLDESTYSRELAPLAGHYPALRLGAPWWFLDSVDGMRRYRQLTTETAGFYNTVGFNDDTRAFCSIPARHDVARRADCAFLAELIAAHQIDETEGWELARALAYGLAKAAYRL